MLIRRNAHELVLIEQVAHAKMAGDIAAQWGNDDFAVPTPHEKATLATAMHDEAGESRIFFRSSMRPNIGPCISSNSAWKTTSSSTVAVSTRSLR